jgi:polyhydroxyalkanoate synthesis regulator phasin
MTRIQKLGAGVVALVAISGAGAAVAATKLRSPQEESRAVVNDAAKQLGVTPERLTNALKTALKNQIDEAVTAGRLTKAEGDRMKARIDANEFPLLGPPFRFGFRHGPGERDFRFGLHFHKLDAAAAYLGMTESALREQLESGKTLAQLARDHNKSVDGLVDALMAEANEHIAEAVKDGKLTQAEADDLVAGLKQRITDLVNGRLPRFRRGDRPRFNGFGGRPEPPLILPSI